MSTSAIDPLAGRAPVTHGTAQGASASSDPVTGLVPATFLDMYRGAITAALDTDGDGKISEAEYERQLVGAGASADDAKTQWQALSGGKGAIADTDFAETIADPFGNERDALLQQIVKELKQGKSAVQPQGEVLDAAGRVADPHATLRYLAAMFPGNMQY